jgi:hypothetical protein
MWRTYGLLLVVLCCLSLPMYSADTPVGEMTDSQLLNELVMLSMEQVDSWVRLPPLLMEVKENLTVSNSRLSSYLTQSGQISLALSGLKTDLTVVSTLLPKVLDALSESKTLLQNSKKDLTVAMWRGITIGVSVGAVVGILTIVLISK